MREILFRGITVDSCRWIFGNLSNYGDSYTGITTTKDFSIIDSAEVIPKTVGQYTGLTDKNKTRIFENDILSAHPDELFPNDEIRLMVVWHDYGWFGKDSKGGFISLESKWVNELFEVIGNKFDNPELLKGSAKNE